MGGKNVFSCMHGQNETLSHVSVILIIHSLYEHLGHPCLAQGAAKKNWSIFLHSYLFFFMAY